MIKPYSLVVYHHTRLLPYCGIRLSKHETPDPSTNNGKAHQKLNTQPRVDSSVRQVKIKSRKQHETLIISNCSPILGGLDESFVQSLWGKSS